MKEKQFYAAMYLRLSRDDEDRDGLTKPESNSIGSQRELIKSFLREQPDIELYDIYVDDGFSGSNFDSISADTGESNIVLPVKNFINDSYCRDISTKVKSQLEIKRRNGECIAAFAVYGYKKSDEDKNRLVIDEYAAENVRRIFAWKIEGMAISAIAEKLNGLGILSPKEYKKSMGLSYNGGFSGTGRSGWGNATIKRILTNQVYLGHMVQGKTEKINYKVKKQTEKPEGEWVKVENTHEAIISADDFTVVQCLMKADGRKSPESGKPSPFMGILFCGDCGEQMIRRTIRYKDTSKVYYICSTKNRGEGCSRHSIKENTLKEIVCQSIRKFANSFLKEKELFDHAVQYETNFDSVVRYDREIERLHNGFSQKGKELETAMLKQEQLIKSMFKQGALSAGRLKIFQDCVELKEIDRRTLSSLVKRICVYEKKQVEIEFHFMDTFNIMAGIGQGILTDRTERSA